MGPEPENLLERDGIEDVLAEDGPPPPVVVVQYGNKLRPWLLTIGAIVVLAPGSAYAYHRREVARLRTQFQLADRDLHRAMERARIEENERRLKALPPAPLVGLAEMSAVLGSAGRGLGPSSGVRSAAGGPTGIRRFARGGGEGPDAGRGGRAAGLGSAGVPASQGPDPAHRGARHGRNSRFSTGGPDRDDEGDRPGWNRPTRRVAASDHRGERRGGTVAVRRAGWSRRAGPDPGPDGRHHRTGVRGPGRRFEARRPAARRFGAARCPAGRASPALPRGDRTADPRRGRRDQARQRSAARAAAGRSPRAPRRRAETVPGRAPDDPQGPGPIGGAGDRAALESLRPDRGPSAARCAPGW